MHDNPYEPPQVPIDWPPKFPLTGAERLVILFVVVGLIALLLPALRGGP